MTTWQERIQGLIEELKISREDLRDKSIRLEKALDAIETLQNDAEGVIDRLGHGRASNLGEFLGAVNGLDLGTVIETRANLFKALDVLIYLLESLPSAPHDA